MAENIRLLACSECKTIEEFPDYEGRPEGDHLLNRLIEKHGPAHRRHIGQMFKVPKARWDDPKAQSEIAKQIAAKLAGGETGLGHEYYDLKNTFQEDAMSCWAKHMNSPACNDYHDPSKRLTPDTAAERKAAGLPAYTTGKDQYLCDFCPVHSLVVTAARKRAGMYDA